MLDDPLADHPYDDFANGPGIHDVEAAIAWVQSHAEVYCPLRADTWQAPCWNGKIELVGNSSGGNLAFEAAARLGPKTETNTLQVDAVGSWSGALRLKVLSTGDWPCAKNQTSKYGRCQSAATNYIKCAAALSTYPPPDACKQYYRDASPDDPDPTNAHPDTYGLPYLDPGLPRAYFANGTPDKDSVPTGKKEIISLQSARDFRDDLGDNGWFQDGSGDTGAFRFCRVNEDLHAKTYIYTDPDPDADPPAEHHYCSGPTGTTDSVFEDMVSFLNSAVT